LIFLNDLQIPNAAGVKLVTLTNNPHQAMNHLAKLISDFYTIKKRRKSYQAMGERQKA